MKKSLKAVSTVLCAALMLSGCAGSRKIIDSKPIESKITEASEMTYKTVTNANPISPIVFCADPTAVEYEGRLYVYGTNDSQQRDGTAPGGKNSYEKIKSLVIFSTDDMVNWTYHGLINVGEIAPWIYNSWAPSICSRVEGDGKTHFYLYFSNSGNGVGVLTATNPLGPWSDPLGKPLIYQNMPGLENCPAPFDPGVVIDENGDGYLSFGGGAPNDSTEVYSSIPKIVKLGDDMLSLDGKFVPINVPFFFEASELNYIDGIYYYSYSTDWRSRGLWKERKMSAPPVCSMAYLTTKTPLDSESWEFRGGFFLNAGQGKSGASGMRWTNNHTHFFEYMGKDYILHHTNLLEENRGEEGGFRSIMVDYLPVDKQTGEIPLSAATREGVKQIKPFDPYKKTVGTTMFTSANINFSDDEHPAAVSEKDGGWILIKSVDFKDCAGRLLGEVKGKGQLKIRLDDKSAEPSAALSFDCEEFTWVRSEEITDISGVHDVYILMTEGVELRAWEFESGSEEE